MPHQMRKAEYFFFDDEDREEMEEMEEEMFLQVQDDDQDYNQDQEENQDEEENQDCEEDEEPYEAPKERKHRELCEQLAAELEEEESLRLAHAMPQREPATEKEMDDSYLEFLTLVQEDREAVVRHTQMVYLNLRLAKLRQMLSLALKIQADELMAKHKAEKTQRDEANKKREQLAAKARAKAGCERNKLGPNAQSRLVAKGALVANPALVKQTEVAKPVGEGRRAQRKAEAVKNPIVVVPRTMIVEQIKLEEAEEVVEVQPEPEIMLVPLVAVDAPLFKDEVKVVKAEVKVDDAWTKVGRTKGQLDEAKKITVGFTSLIQQRKNANQEARYEANPGMVALALAAQVKPSELTCTRLCNSLFTGVKCTHGDRCRFAHSLEKLVRKPCAFGTRCKLVVKISEGVYRNKPSEHSGKTCQFIHDCETLTSYGERLGLRTAQAKVAPKVVAKVAPKVVPEPIKLVVQPRKTRWDQPAPQVAPQVQVVQVAPQVQVTPQVPRKTRWEPAPQPKVQPAPRKTRWEQPKPQVQITQPQDDDGWTTVKKR